LDEELLDGLKARGFKTYFGSDGTGFQMMYMRGEGGYYIDVGCSAYVCDGSIGVLQTDDMTGFVAEGLELQGGDVVRADLVVLATGFQNMQENVRRMFGDPVAEKIGKVWGFDEDYQMRAMWRRTGQEGLWITGGALLDSRLFSRFMSLEIKADLEGILPAKDALPMRRAAA
jgi:putative flavoprotein involved in K+ transport